MNIEVLKSKIFRVRKAQMGDIALIISYASMAHEEAKKYKTQIVFPDYNNRLA